ncbi:MAG: hypothetical protein NDF54_09620 [archaeon GB-1867-035]|nr:hypothetical protein [Candidatus Culexmicrobium profundum]
MIGGLSVLVCIDYSGDSRRVFGLIVLKEVFKANLVAHYSEVKGRFAKKKLLDRFPNRFQKVSAYIECLIVSDNLTDILSEIGQIKDEIKSSLCGHSHRQKENCS